MSKLKPITELAKEHMRERYLGGTKRRKKETTASHYGIKKGKCIMCGREMTIVKEENEPYYCYKCHQDAEGVFGRG